MGLKITTLSKEPVNHSPLYNRKSFINLVKQVTMTHSVKLKCLKMLRIFFNLIGHGVVMEGERKMTGCLQTLWALYMSAKSF